MIKTLHLIYKVKTSSRINVLLYFLKKIPILKRKLKNTNYSLPKFKQAIGIVSIIYSLISIPIESFLVFLLMYLPSIFIAKENAHLALATLIFFFYFLFSIVRSKVLEYDPNKFTMVKQMRMNARDYSLATIFPGEIIRFMGTGTILTMFLNFGPYPLFGIVLAISMTCFSFFGEAIHIFIYDKYGKTMVKSNILLVIIYLIIFLAGYALALISPFNIFLNMLTSPIFIMSTVVLGIWGGIYLYRYDDYAKAINEVNNIEKMDEIKTATKDIRFGDVKIKEKDFKDEDLSTNKFSNKEGYSYLNSIFFDRHKRIVYKPMMIKSLIILVVFAAFIILSEFFYEELGPVFGDKMYKFFNWFVFLMYILCNSERITKSMFYNCDLSLLRYGFYKKGDALLKMFFLRLLRIIYSNIVPTTILAIGVTFSIMNYTDIGFGDVIPIILLLYALAMFFSVHYIFMYYIFQPYTSSFEIKSPFYSIINFLVYFVSYMLIQIPAPPAIFLPIVTGLLLLYITIAILLVYKKAPKTFRIR